jgi:hypothetical protein
LPCPSDLPKSARGLSNQLVTADTATSPNTG